MWENNVQVVVMLTGLVEQGKAKCERYWPSHTSDEAMRFGPISVRTMNIKVFHLRHKTINSLSQADDGYTRSELHVSVGSQARKVVHFWFTGWPDHGVPRNAEKEMHPDQIICLLVLWLLLISTLL